MVWIKCRLWCDIIVLSGVLVAAAKPPTARTVLQIFERFNQFGTYQLAESLGLEASATSSNW